MVACGGTGGHFFPGYVLGGLLRERGHEVLYLLRKDDPAKARLEAEDRPYAELDIHGLPRGLSARALSLLWKVPAALKTSARLLRAFRPAAVAGTGSYITLPAAAAARLSGIPYVLHEANAALGLANRLLAGGAFRLALGLPLAGKAPRGARTELTGTPIRESLWVRGEAAAARAALGLEPGLPTLLVFGGSQGARSLNETVPVAAGLAARDEPLQVLHLTGPGKEAGVAEAYARAGGRLKSKVLAALGDMAAAYAAADAAVCRAGAGTAAELIAQRLPAVLVPFPGAAGGHQEVNARLLAGAGASECLVEAELTPESLAERLRRLFGPGGEGARRSMSDSCGGLKVPPPGEAGRLLAGIVEEAITQE